MCRSPLVNETEAHKYMPLYFKRVDIFGKILRALTFTSTVIFLASD